MSMKKTLNGEQLFIDHPFQCPKCGYEFKQTVEGRQCLVKIRCGGEGCGVLLGFTYDKEIEDFRPVLVV